MLRRGDRARRATWVCGALLTAGAASAEPPPEETRYLIRSDTLLTADRWRGARVDAVDRTDVRQRLALDVYFAAPDPRPRRLRMAWYTDLEVGSDLGPVPADLEAVPDARRVELDLHHAFLAVTDIAGAVDVLVGRHTLFDVLGYDGLDGATVRVRAVPYVSAELTGGLAVRRGWSDFGPDIFSPDGTRLSDEVGYLVGAALATRDLHWLHARAAWRRQFDDHVQTEEAGVAAELRPLPRLSVLGELRYDAIYLRPSEVQAVVAGAPLPELRLEAGWRRSVPSFSADSIWNAFSVEPFHEARGGGRLELGAWRLAADGSARFYDASDAAAQAPGLDGPTGARVEADAEPAWEAGAEVVRGLLLLARPAHVGAEARVGGGYGGERTYGDLFGRFPLPADPGEEPLWLRVRLGAVHFDDGFRRDRDGALSGWALLGLEWRPVETVRLDTLVEAHASELTPYRLRAFARASFEDLW